MSSNKTKRSSISRAQGSHTVSSPAVGRGDNDKVATGSNPRYSPFKGISRLQTGAGVQPKTKTQTRKVAVKSGIKNHHTGAPTKRVNKKLRPIPSRSTGRKNVQAGQKSYPSKRLMSIMDPEERGQF